MRIDTINKIIYIANPKTGSTSLRKMMDKYNDNKLFNKLNNNNDFNHHYNFQQWKKILLKYEINIEDYFVFTTIRNPFKRIISYYNYSKFDKNGCPFWHDNYIEYDKNYSWETFIEIAKDSLWYFLKFINYNNDKYNLIIKIEDFDINDINNKIYKHCGKSNYFDKKLKLNVTKKLNSLYYQKQSHIDKVANIFKDDIHYGNYEIININEL